MARVIVFYEKLWPMAYKADTTDEAQKVMQYVLRRRIGNQEYYHSRPKTLKAAIKASENQVDSAVFLNEHRTEMYSDYNIVDVIDIAEVK